MLMLMLIASGVNRAVSARARHNMAWVQVCPTRAWCYRNMPRLGMTENPSHARLRFHGLRVLPVGNLAWFVPVQASELPRGSAWAMPALLGTRVVSARCGPCLARPTIVTWAPGHISSWAPRHIRLLLCRSNV